MFNVKKNKKSLTLSMYPMKLIACFISFIHILLCLRVYMMIVTSEKLKCKKM